jgi:hypothetical protein
MGGGTSEHTKMFKPPANRVETWNITGLNYRGNKIDIIYDMGKRSVEIRNRPRQSSGSAGSGAFADERLEVIFYEGNYYWDGENNIKSLRVGESVFISLTTENWSYDRRRSREQRQNGHSENMHVLASIYPVHYSRYLVRPNDANRLATTTTTLTSILIIVNFFLIKFISN